MKDYIEIQLRKKSQDLFLLVFNKAIRIKENKGFVESFKESASRIVYYLSQSCECYDKKEKIKYYSEAIRTADSVMFYNRFFFESGQMSEKRFKVIDTSCKLIIDLSTALIKAEQKVNYKDYLFKLNYVR
jgi:hypothetical protein